MWIEAVVTQADVVKVLTEILPVRILLDSRAEAKDDGSKAEPERSLLLRPASLVTLVPEEGIQITCPAELTWTFIGMSPTVQLDELRVMLRPRVVEKNHRPVLEVALEVQVADFHSLPAFIDEAIVRGINGALATRGLHWGFTETLARTVPLGAIFDLVEALRLSATWGETKITAEALGLVISLQLEFVRSE